MSIFLDSSALAKRYLDEPGSDKVEALCSQGGQIVVSIICLPEIVSALNRRKRDRLISFQQYELIKQRLLAEFEDFLSYPLTPQVIASTIEYLEKYSLRAMDALHLACAVDVACAIFVSADARQLEAARKLKLKILKV